MTPAARRALVPIAVLVLGGCGIGAGGVAPVTLPPQSFGPGGSGTAVLTTAREVVEAALGTRRVVVDEPQVPYRPAETAAFAAARRTVLQAVLPDDPAHGYIAIYEFADPTAAAAAAAEQAAYVGSAVGRVQFPTGTQFVIRVLGSTVVFYASPPESPDEQEADVVTALRTIGTEVPVPG